MRKKYKVHLRSGTTITFKADDVTVKWNRDTGEFTEWNAQNVDRWLFFMPTDLVAVERLR